MSFRLRLSAFCLLVSSTLGAVGAVNSAAGLPSTNSAGTAHAARAVDSEYLRQQREWFQQAERAWRKNQFSAYRKLKEKLVDYPLFSYLEYEELVRDIKRIKPEQVEAYLAAYPGSHLAKKLRVKWLDRLAKAEKWHNYLAFDYDTDWVPNRCRTGYAQYRAGYLDEAFSVAEELWMVGKSQPEQCDALFKAWEKAGLISPEMRWQRARLAIQKGQISLAKYVAKPLGRQDRDLIEEWGKLRSAPQRVLRAALQKSDSPHIRDIVAYGMLRWARKDLDKAIKAWPKVDAAHRFSQSQRADVISYIALRLMRKRRQEAIDWLAKVPLEQASQEALERVVKVALVHESWNDVLAAVRAMDKDKRLKDEWRYWQARALEALGEPHTARKFYAGLSLTRGYYAFLAADQIGAPYTMDDQPLEIEEAVQDSVSSHPAVLRAAELVALDRKLQARREWWTLTTQLDRVQLRAAAKVAQSWGWHSRAISAVARSGHFNDLELRFPLAFNQHVSKHARAQDLDQAWIFALMRQESAFNAEARSSAGARGLMQLMPATAKMVARKMRVRYSGTRQLNNPDTNIRFGTWYLRHVLDKLGNNPILATAAYNAGPHRVQQWLPEKTGLAADIWVEAIPFTETRKYVKRILTYSVIYEERMGLSPARISERMPAIGSEVPVSAPHRGGHAVKASLSKPTGISTASSAKPAVVDSRKPQS